MQRGNSEVCFILGDPLTQSRPDRTGVGTRSLFGEQVKYDLSSGRVPFLTCKRLPWKSVIQELLWYISGSTNVAPLHKAGIHYWDANSSREFLDARGLVDYPEGELGPVYGGHLSTGPGLTLEQDTSGGSGEVRWTSLRKSFACFGRTPSLAGSSCRYPCSIVSNCRRSAWNVSDLPKMALPPCHCFVQFTVDAEYHLHCILYQRSADLVLGVSHAAALPW